MHYIIFDLEFNQDFKSKKNSKNIDTIRCPFEIIQIGAVKLDENFQLVSSFDKFIKPTVYTKMHPFVQDITGITIEQLNDAKSFIEVYKELIEFVKSERSILSVWGLTDIKELFRNAEYHGLDTSLIPLEYINIQFYASKYLNCPKGTNVGLRNAVELLNIDLKDEFHDAYNDAYYTAEIFKKIYTDKIEPKMYSYKKAVNPNHENNGRRKVDMVGLFKQFEKMFDREMTEEEKFIIKLAYMMGKTNQFLL